MGLFCSLLLHDVSDMAGLGSWWLWSVVQPWPGVSPCIIKLHLYLVFPVILYLLVGSWCKSNLKSLVYAVGFCWFTFIKHKKKCKCHHCHSNVKLVKWRCRASPVALVVCCWRRPTSKTVPHLVSTVFISEPVHWKWKTWKWKVGLADISTELMPSFFDNYWVVDHVFLQLPQLLNTLCNHSQFLLSGSVHTCLVTHNSFVPKKVKREHASKIWSALKATGFYAALYFFGGMSLKVRSASSKQCPGTKVSIQAFMYQKPRKWELSHSPEGGTPLALAC